MKKAGNNAEGQKARISKLAIASVVIPLVICIASLYTIFAVQGRYYRYLAILGFVFGPIVLVSFYLAPVAFVLGLASLIKIKMSRGLLKGYIFACVGLLLSVISWSYGRMALLSPRREARIHICQENMRLFAEALRSYSNDHDGEYPTADKWCDLLAEYKEWSERAFLCPQAREGSVGGYAINPKATPNSASDVVLVFDTNCDWELCRNRFGGEELLSVANHKGEGCNILFNDGHVEFIKATPDALCQLNWGDEADE